METQVFSTDIKVGKVAPVYKSREKDDLNAYRPISVLPIVDRFLKIPFMGSNLLTLLALFCNSKGTGGGGGVFSTPVRFFADNFWSRELFS